MKRVSLFRHGETDYNAESRFQGHLDVPLNDRGRAQAHALVGTLAPRGIEIVLASDLSRAAETGRIVAEGLGVSLHTDARLREAHLGLAQGLTRLEIERRFGSVLVGRWRSAAVTDADVSFPEGETGAQVRDRAFAALEDFLAVTDHERVGVATHGGVIRRVLRALLPEDAPPVPIPNGVIYELGWRPDSRTWSVLDEIPSEE